MKLQLESGGLLPRLRRQGKTHIWVTKPEIEVPLLASHAGFSCSLDLCLGFSLFTLPRGEFDQIVAEAARDLNSWLYEASRKRGGKSLVGGPFWCDLTEFVPTLWTLQVFGHTRCTVPERRTSYACINVQDDKFVGMIVDEAGKFVSWRKIEEKE